MWEQKMQKVLSIHLWKYEKVKAKHWTPGLEYWEWLQPNSHRLGQSGFHDWEKVGLASMGWWVHESSKGSLVLSFPLQTNIITLLDPL